MNQSNSLPNSEPSSEPSTDALGQPIPNLTEASSTDEQTRTNEAVDNLRAALAKRKATGAGKEVMPIET